MKGKLNHPSSTILITNVSKRTLLKVHQWLLNHDKVEVCPNPDHGELWLLNQTKRESKRGRPWTNEEYDKFVMETSQRARSDEKIVCFEVYCSKCRTKTLMEDNIVWKYCPICGEKVAIIPKGDSKAEKIHHYEDAER